jgi:hypothetical protein
MFGLDQPSGTSKVNYLDGDSVRYFHLTSDGLPVAGTKYVVEEELSIFETDKFRAGIHLSAKPTPRTCGFRQPYDLSRQPPTRSPTSKVNHHRITLP